MFYHLNKRGQMSNSNITPFGPYGPRPFDSRLAERESALYIAGVSALASLFGIIILSLDLTSITQNKIGEAITICGTVVNGGISLMSGYKSVKIKRQLSARVMPVPIPSSRELRPLPTPSQYLIPPARSHRSRRSERKPPIGPRSDLSIRFASKQPRSQP